MLLVLVAGAMVLLGLIVAGFVARTELTKAQPQLVELNLNGPRWFWPLARPYKLPLVVGFSLTLLLTLIELALPWSLKLLVDHAIGGEPLPEIFSPLRSLDQRELAMMAIVAGLVVVLVRAIIKYLVSYLIGAAEIRVSSDMRDALLRRVQDLSLHFHARNRASDLVSRLTSDLRLVRTMMFTWLDRVVPQILTLVGAVVAMLIIDVYLTLIALSVVPILIYYAFAKWPKISSVQRQALDRQGDPVNHADDSTRNGRSVQAFTQPEVEGDRFARQLDGPADAPDRALDGSAIYRPLSSIAVGLGTALVSWFGVNRIFSGEMTLGTLVVFLSYLCAVYRPMRSLSRLVSTFAEGAAGRNRLLDLYADGLVVEDGPAAREAPPGVQPILLRSLTFHNNDGTPVLDRLGVAITPGAAVCVVGASRVGRSTLLSLLLRLHEPTGGTIEYGGVPTNELTLASFRQRLALVSEEPWMVNGSIRDNVVFGNQHYNEATLQAAVRQAHLHEFVADLPQGLDTPVGEGGLFLSHGQRRRVGLARALVRNAPVLLVDEPTGGLDAAASRPMLDAIDRASRGRTAIIVSDDLKVARHVDQILVMHEGRFVEFGTHDTLMAASQRYAQLWRDQSQLRLVSPSDDSQAPADPNVAWPRPLTQR